MGNRENREEEEKTEVSEERAVDAQEWKVAYILQVMRLTQLRN